MHTRGTGATQGSGTIAPHAVAPHGFACLSVCIAARNEAGCIGRCIASVRRAFAACKGTLEIVVADGGSTDATAEIARDHGAAVIVSAGGGRGGGDKASAEATVGGGGNGANGGANGGGPAV